MSPRAGEKGQVQISKRFRSDSHAPVCVHSTQAEAKLVDGVGVVCTYTKVGASPLCRDSGCSEPVVERSLAGVTVLDLPAPLRGHAVSANRRPSHRPYIAGPV